jgi:ABC-type glycerol-3-phosphate transport system substrate-binding protein
MNRRFGMKARTLLATLAACAALVACGGGGGGGGGAATTTTADNLPAGAVASASALVAYLMELIGTAIDTSEPLALGDATLPVTDTAEPTAL